jgi:hypothetical protein
MLTISVFESQSSRCARIGHIVYTGRNTKDRAGQFLRRGC